MVCGRIKWKTGAAAYRQHAGRWLCKKIGLGTVLQLPYRPAFKDVWLVVLFSWGNISIQCVTKLSA